MALVSAHLNAEVILVVTVWVQVFTLFTAVSDWLHRSPNIDLSGGASSLWMLLLLLQEIATRGENARVRAHAHTQ